LRAVFKVMGYKDEKIEKEFGHILEAFKYGAPPHGGIAHGVERLIMVLAGEEYLREVQAFPQTGSGRTSVMDAPAEVDKGQLDELGIEVKKEK
ncbi:MAG: amino acid--tRNA ligase-related protein, partial [bacterium]|nr:amino acid--tRNA ligase-related protein [bacterium]